MAESFLESALKRRASQVGPVPTELVEGWADDGDNLSAAYLLHPAVRGHQDSGATEEDVRAVLEKKKLTLTSQVSTSDFTKLASRVHKRASSSDASSSQPAELTAAESEALQALAELVATPRWRADDALPARFAPKLLCGSAEHANDLGALRTAGVTAVLNCAPGACDDPVDAYDEYGIRYAELDAEDFDGYPLLELHLDAAQQFIEEQCAADNGLVLIHCYAGVNRSAALAIATTMMHEAAPLLDVAERCWSARPFILNNEGFRRELVKCASARGLLKRRDPDGYEENYAEVRL